MFLCTFVYTCYFCDIRVSLCACVYSAVGWLSAAAPAASRSTWIREALPTLKNGADLFENDTNVSEFVSFSPRIRRKSHESCVSRQSKRELDQIKGNPGVGLWPIPTREGKNDGI